MKTPSIPTIDLRIFPQEVLTQLAKDVALEAHGELLDSDDDMDDASYRRALIDLIQFHAPSTAIH